MTSPSRPGTHAYADTDAVATMHADCRAAEARLDLARAARRAVRPAPGITVADQPRETRKRDLEISEAAAALAAALYGADYGTD